MVASADAMPLQTRLACPFCSIFLDYHTGGGAAMASVGDELISGYE